jgi:hypothetical protein
MARECYIIPFTVTNPTTVPFLQLATPTNAGLSIIEFEIGHETVPTSEQIVLTLIRRTTASTLPTAAAINPLDPTAPTSRLASSTTTNAYGIATATGTAGVSLQRWTFNALNGKLWVPVPKSVAEMDISQFVTFQFPTAPANAVIGGYVVVEEL